MTDTEFVRKMREAAVRNANYARHYLFVWTFMACVAFFAAICLSGLAIIAANDADFGPSAFLLFIASVMLERGCNAKRMGREAHHEFMKIRQDALNYATEAIAP